MVKRGTLSAETVGLGSVLRVAPFAPCANAWLCLTNDRSGLLGARRREVSPWEFAKNGDAYSGV
jgi:hypothetical protein